MGFTEADEILAPILVALLGSISVIGEQISIISLHCLEGLFIYLVCKLLVISIPVAAVEGDPLLDIFRVDDIERSLFHTIRLFVDFMPSHDAYIKAFREPINYILIIKITWYFHFIGEV